jgi:aminoglycoside phosphotransferase family enzyme/predicted kinase
MAENRTDDQSAVIRFLLDPASYPERPDRVERMDTHGAIIFLAGDRAYKLKRAVKLAYLDFSTLEKRRAVCERELELNRRTAPALYLGLIPVTRDEHGGLRLGGSGEAVDWVIEMRRFGQEQLFDRMARAGKLEPALLERLVRHIQAFHSDAPRRTDAAWPDSLIGVAGTVISALGDTEFDTLGTAGTRDALRDRIERARPLLAARREAGFVRRCHGDMHLKNIVLIDGEPCLFDALEFDEDLATVDVLYDLGFLLMDLWGRGLKREANAVLNRYFARDVAAEEWAGLSLLPLFMSLRAGVRAMVGLDGLRAAAEADCSALREEMLGYADLAGALIAPPGPRLVAIGGMSGTGKTTVARAVAAGIGPAPGAIHLRSDVERKVMFGAAPTEPLGPEGYAPQASRAVYERLVAKAEAILRAGHAVVLDATFLEPDSRRALERLARSLGVPFQPVWLKADAEAMIRRVTNRRGDASDADAEIVRKQIEAGGEAPHGWTIIETDGDAETTALRVAASIGARV